MYISHYETKVVLNSNLMIATFLIIRLATLKKLCYEESLVSSNLNSKIFWFHSAHPNVWPYKLWTQKRRTFTGLTTILLNQASVQIRWKVSGIDERSFRCATIRDIWLIHKYYKRHLVYQYTTPVFTALIFSYDINNWQP